ncbi:DMT family transporter [Clostridium sp. DL1XJH146]
MKIKDIGVLFLLAALWGASFLFMRVAAPVLGAVFLIEIRVLIAGLALLIYAFIIKKKPNFKEKWKEYLILGAINSAIPFTLIATATLTLNASIASILNSATPIFTVIVASIWLKEKLTVKKLLGILIGIIGVVVLLGWSPMLITPKVIIAASMSILATICYGFAGVFAKKAFKDVDSLSIATGQQLSAAIVLLPFAIFNIPSGHISSNIILSVFALAIMCTSIAYVLYFYLIKEIGPTKTLSVTLLVPMFGVVWGVIFLGEKITSGMLLGLGIILMSIFMISDLKIGIFSSKRKNIDIN